MNKPLYICFEGLDGSGKSTLCDYIVNALREKYNVCCLCPTKKVSAPNQDSINKVIEWIFDKCHKLKKSSYFRQFLYAYRSNYATSQIDWNADLILGDRSLITSYVCRWSKLDPQKNQQLVNRVNFLEPNIPPPDHVIYLEVSHEEIQRRLNQRGERDIDETPERSKDMRCAYDYIRTQPNAIQRLSNTKWHIINGNLPVEDVRRETLRLIYDLIKDIRKNERMTRNENHN